MTVRRPVLGAAGSLLLTVLYVVLALADPGLASTLALLYVVPLVTFLALSSSSR